METMIQVLDQDPVPISQMNSTIPHDLETICLKCLQKDPARRYASAEALAEDIQRYLDDEPIVARPPTRVEQLGRWVRKNKATAIATGVVAASLLVATVISISFAVEASRQRDVASDQRDVAEIAKQEADQQRAEAEQAKEEAKRNASEATQRADELQQISDFQANQLANVDPRRMGQAIRKMVMDQSLAASQRAGKKRPDIDIEMATLERLLKGTDFTGIALKVLDKQIFDGAIEELDNFENQPLVQARLLQVISDTLRTLGLFEQAVGPQLRALEIRQRELLPTDPSRLLSVNNYGVLLKARGAYKAAEPLLREALKNRQKTLGDCDSDTLVSVQELSHLLMTQRRLSEAETTLRNSLDDLREELGDHHPETLKMVSQLANLVHLADNRKEAISLLREVLATCRRLKGEDHIDTFDAQLELGNLLIWEHFEAAGDFEKITRNILDELGGKQDPKADLTSIKALELLIACLMNQMKLKEKLEAGKELVTRCQLAFGDEHTKTLEAMKSYASNGLFTETWDFSERVLKEVLAIERRKVGSRNEQTLSTITTLGMVLASQDKNQEAENLYREAFDGFTALNQEQVAQSVGGELGALILKRGDIATAEPLLLSAWSLHKDMEDLYYLEEGVQVDVLELYIAKGDWDEAEKLQRKVMEGLVREKCSEESINKAKQKLDSILDARKVTDCAGESKNETGHANEPADNRSPGGTDSPLDSLLPGRNEIHIAHEGQSRRLLITTPKSFQAGQRYPVLFCFHGAGGKADGQSKRWSRHVDPRNLVLVSCEAVQPMAKWNFMDEFHAVDHDDVGLVIGVAQNLIKAQFADPCALFATGHSSGGLFCYRLAKQTDLFTAFAPMSCGMVKGAHTPADSTRPISILQVIGDQDKSFHGSTNPKVTMYSAEERIGLWRSFNGCAAQPVVTKAGEEVTLRTYTAEDGIEVVLCEVQGQGHHLRGDLRDDTDKIALDFLFKHRRDQSRGSGEKP